MGDLGLQYDYNYHLERIEDVKTVDLDVLAKSFALKLIFAGSVASINASVSLKKKQNKKLTRFLGDMPVLMLILVVVKFQSMLVSLSKKKQNKKFTRFFGVPWG